MDPRNLLVGAIAALSIMACGGDALDTETSSVTEESLVSVRGKATANTGAGVATSVALPKPSGVVTGDFLLASIAVHDSAITITPPASWTEVYRKNVTPTSGASMSLTTYKKVATGAEPSSYVFTVGVARVIQGAIVAFAGVDDIGSFSGRVFTSATTAPSAPAFNVGAANAQLVALFANRNDAPAFSTWTPPSTFTEIVDAHTTRTTSGAGNMALEIAAKSVATVGSYGPFTATPSGSGIAATQILALAPKVCVPTTCAIAGTECGSIPNGCGGTLDCGGCGAGEACNSNVCEVTSRFYGDPGAGKVYVGAANGFGSRTDLVAELKPYNGNVNPVMTAERIYSSSPSSLTDPNDINLPSGVRTQVSAMVAAGVLPVITSKWYAAGKASILAGAIDTSHIKPLADYFKSLAPAPVVYAPWHEMAEDFNTGTDYTQVFRYIILKLRAYGVTNMAVAFVPTSSSMTSGLANGFYPGDDVIDIVGADGYNFYTDLGYSGLSGPEFNIKWRDCRAIFQATVDFAQAHNKPLGVFELGTPTATNLTHVKDRWKSTNDGQGPANLNTSTNKTLAQINAEWWSGPGGIPWLYEHGLVLLTYWSSGGNSSSFQKSWSNGTYSLTRRGSDKYASPNNVHTEASSPRAQGFVDLLNEPYVADFPTALGL